MKVSYLLKLDVERFLIFLHQIVSEHISNVPILLIKGTLLTNSLHQDHLHIAESTWDRHDESFWHHSVLGVLLLQAKAWFGFGLPKENTKGINCCKLFPGGLVIYLAWKYKSIAAQWPVRNQTVIFGHYQSGPDAECDLKVKGPGPNS